MSVKFYGTFQSLFSGTRKKKERKRNCTSSALCTFVAGDGDEVGEVAPFSSWKVQERDESADLSGLMSPTASRWSKLKLSTLAMTWRTPSLSFPEK